MTRPRHRRVITGVGAAVLVAVALSCSSTTPNALSAGGPGTTAGSVPNSTADPAAGDPNLDVGNMPGVKATGTNGTAAPSAKVLCPNLPGAMDMGDGHVMAPTPNRPPTADERAAADKLVADTRAGTQAFQDRAAAIADGYKVVTNPKLRVQHWANFDVTRRHDVLDPQHPDVLVYADTAKGPKLLGAMYLSGGSCVPGPDIGGPLTMWHAHDNLCKDDQSMIVGIADANGACPKGHKNETTYFMLHVWLAPSLGDPLQPEIDRTKLAPIIRTGNL